MKRCVFSSRLLGLTQRRKTSDGKSNLCDLVWLGTAESADGKLASWHHAGNGVKMSVSTQEACFHHSAEPVTTTESFYHGPKTDCTLENRSRKTNFPVKSSAHNILSIVQNKQKSVLTHADGLTSSKEPKESRCGGGTVFKRGMRKSSAGRQLSNSPYDVRVLWWHNCSAARVRHVTQSALFVVCSGSVLRVGVMGPDVNHKTDMR